MSKQQLKAATADAPVTSSGSSVASSLNGTLHVKVLRAKNLPRMDFGKRQDPFVLVQLEGSSPKSWATTDPAFQGGTDPEWHAKLNNELELFYDASLHDKDAVLTVEVFSDETGDDLIGTGQVNVGKIAKNQMTNETDFTVKLKDALGGVENRGEVLLTVWWGPPVRKAFRAAQRATKLLDVRDNVVSTLYALVDNALASKYLAGPTAFAKKHRNVSIAAAALLGIAAAGAIGLFVAIAVPTLVVATFTLPFWIIPFVVTAFFTAPLWIPVVLLLCGVGALLATVVFGFGVTSRPVRRQGALLSARIKHSDMGKRVVYEKHV